MLKESPFHSKLYATFSIIIALIFLVFGVFFYHYNAGLLETSMEENSMDSLHLAQTRMEDLLLNMDRSLKTLHSSRAFTDIVIPIHNGFTNYFALYPSRATDVKSSLYAILNSESRSGEVSYISRYYDYISAHSGSFAENGRSISKEVLAENIYVKQGLTSSSFQIYCPPHKDIWQNSKSVFSVIRPIRDTYTIYGMLEYSMDVSELSKILDFSGNEDAYELILTDSGGSLLYSTIGEDKNESISSIYEGQAITGEEGRFYVDNNTLIVHVTSEMTGWNLLLKRDITEYTANVHTFAKTLFLYLLLAYLLLLLFLYLIILKLTKPLRNLTADLSAIDINQDIHVNIGSSDNEIAMLTTAIADILNKIRAQNVQLLETKKRALHAHFSAMEAQLNPHFLYNTLSVISSYALELDNPVIPKMCTELSNLLRYSIAYNHKTVSLKDELSNIASYLYIMKMRHEHMLEYTWDLEEGLGGIRVPKLILQPIVENCFQHGFANVPPVWNIHIQTCSKGDLWFVRIINNGAPFPTDTISRIYSRFEQMKHIFTDSVREEEASQKQGFGLENTIMRLYIFYRGREHFQVTSKDGMTIVEIGGRMDEKPDEDFTG